jgi:hypothetical protein
MAFIMTGPDLAVLQINDAKQGSTLAQPVPHNQALPRSLGFACLRHTRLCQLHADDGTVPKVWHKGAVTYVRGFVGQHVSHGTPHLDLTWSASEDPTEKPRAFSAVPGLEASN